MTIKIRKRQGYLVNYDREQLYHSISPVIPTQKEQAQVVCYCDSKIKALDGIKQHLSIEELLDLVQNSLVELNFKDEAAKFAAYREERKRVREAKKIKVDVESTIEDYVGQLDWRVNENANQGYSVGGMILNTSGKVTANYWLSSVYPQRVGQAHRDGRIHIHDLSFLGAYCCGWDLKRLLDEGLNGLKGHIDSKPPKNLSGAVGQMVNALGVLQNEAAGAQAYSSADTYLAPFVRELRKKIENEYRDVISMTGGTVDAKINADRLKAYVDEKLHKEVYQCIQELIFNLNVPSRWGSQTPFTNLTFDLTCPEDLKDRKPKIGGVEVEDYTYGDLQEEMNLLNNVFVEVYMKGDAKGQPFTFPIPTYNITKDFDWNSKFVDSVFEMAAKYGLPYFQNFISSDMKPSQIRSMCCRLRLDKRELLKRGNGLFGSAEQTGSIGVVTINLARLGYKHKGDKEGLYKELDELLIIAKDSLEIKRAIVSKLLDQGFYPALSRYLSHFNNHFSTIGINGGNEMIRNFTNDEEDISTEYGQRMMLDMMDYLRQRMSDFQEETGNLYNIEAAPCEGCFAGDTLVQTYEGNIAIKDLVGKKDLLVYSRNNKTNKVELKKARAYQTSKNAEVLEIEFDNGQKIVCTPQHPIARNHWNGRRGTEIEWVPAELLQPGMSIKSNYIYDKQGHLYSSCDRRAIHVINAEYAYGPRKKGYVVHHKDENKHNNAFENLQYLTSTEHKSLHWGVGGNPSSVNPRYGEANPFYGKKHTAESKAKMSAALKGRHCETNDMEAFRKIMSDSAKAKPREKTSQFRHDIDESKILNLWNKGYDLIEICKKLPEKYTYSIIKGRLKHFGIDISLRARVVRNNHKVVAIRRLSKKIPVYNIEVQDNHNYFVGGAQGILVHNCMYRFALADKKAFGDSIIQAGPKEAPYYTNSSQLPVSFTDDIFEALDLQNDLQCKYTGGTVLHLYMAERVSSTEVAKTLVRKIFENYTLPYITFTPTFSICPVHGYLAGEHEYCPICDAEIEKRAKSCCNCETEKTI